MTAGTGDLRQFTSVHDDLTPVEAAIHRLAVFCHSRGQIVRRFSGQILLKLGAIGVVVAGDLEEDGHFSVHDPAVLMRRPVSLLRGQPFVQEAVKGALLGEELAVVEKVDGGKDALEQALPLVLIYRLHKNLLLLSSHLEGGPSLKNGGPRCRWVRIEVRHLMAAVMEESAIASVPLEVHGVCCWVLVDLLELLGTCFTAEETAALMDVWGALLVVGGEDLVDELRLLEPRL